MIRPYQSRFLPGAAAKVFAAAVILTLAPGMWAGSKYRVLHSFSGGPKDGGGVFGGVGLDKRGSVYGTTTGGGAYGYGTLFQLTPGARGQWAETILHSFCQHFPHCSDGDSATSTPVFDSAGNLYGSTGTATFELTPIGDSSGLWKFRIISDLGSDADLVLDRTRDLYGIGGPGKYGRGAVAELLPGSKGWKKKVLYSFCPVDCHDGDEPTNRLTRDAGGNLYGTTLSGGKYHLGVVFQLKRTASGWTEHALHSFPAFSTDGWRADSGVVVDAAGHVYGVTNAGGIGCDGNGCGTVFELARQADGSWKETILFNFPKLTNGAGPYGGMVLGKDGSLYGTTAGGGYANCSCGTVFKMTPGTNGKWSYTVLHRFSGTDGFDPQGSLILDGKGNIYGTTTEGGAGGYGVVFEITP